MVIERLNCKVDEEEKRAVLGQSACRRWEVTFQRNALLDGITMLRAAATAATKPEDFESLVQTLYWEQVCKFRKAMAPRHDATWWTPPA